MLGCCVRSSFEQPLEDCLSYPTEASFGSDPALSEGDDIEEGNNLAEPDLEESCSSLSTGPTSSAKSIPPPQSSKAKKPSIRWRDVFTTDNRQSAILAIGIPVASALVGLHTITMYSVDILEAIEFQNNVTGSILFGFCMFVSSACITLYLKDVGCSKTVLVSLFGLSLACIGISILDVLGRHLGEPLAAVILILCFPVFVPGCILFPHSIEPSSTRIPTFFWTTGRVLASLVAFLHVLFFPTLLKLIGVQWSFLIFAFFGLSTILSVDRALLEDHGRGEESAKRISNETNGLEHAECA